MSATNSSPYAALLLRVSLGALFLAHGLLKVFVFTLPGTVKFFASLGYPARSLISSSASKSSADC